MAGTGPVIAVDPVALLTDDPPRQAPYIYKYLPGIVGAGIGILSMYGFNKLNKRPALSGNITSTII